MRSWTLNQLRTFMAVAKSGTMGAAATELGYTVGAISQQMQALQLEAGAALFIKDGRRLVLSDAGHLLMEHASSILAVEEEADRALGNFGDGVSSTVRLGVFGSSVLMCVSLAMSMLNRDEPCIRVILREIDPESAVEAVTSGVVDLALGLEYSGLPVSDGPTLIREALVTEPLLVVAHEGHSQQFATPPDGGLEVGVPCDKRGWLLPPERSSFGRAARRVALGATGGVVNAHVVVDTALALALSIEGHGYTVATQSMLDFHRSPASVVFATGVERTMVLLAKSASLQRPSALRVRDALVRAGEGFSEGARNRGGR